MNEPRICDCGRPIFGTRSISARHYEKCSVCRGPRARRPPVTTVLTITLPPYVITPDGEQWAIMDTRTGSPAAQNGWVPHDRYLSAEAAQSVANSLNAQAHLEPLRAEEAAAREAIERAISAEHDFATETEARYEQLRQRKASAIAVLQDVQARLYAAENPEDA